MPRFRRVRWNACILLSIWSVAGCGGQETPEVQQRVPVVPEQGASRDSSDASSACAPIHVGDSMATLRRTLGPPSVVEIYAIKSEELWSWHCNDGITSTVIFDERDVVVWTMATATVGEAGP